jgi:hypothetical protein
LIKPLLDSLKAGVKRGPYVVPDLVERPPQFTPPKPPDAGNTPPGVVVKESRDTQAAESAAPPPHPPQPGSAPANEPKTQNSGTRAPRRNGGRAKRTAPPAYGKGDLRNVATQLAAGASVDEALNKVRGVCPEDESSGEGAAG